TFRSFLAQSFSFGRNRINVSRYHPGSVGLIHILPLVFLFGWLAWIILSLFNLQVFYLGGFIFGFWTLGILFSASVHHKSILVGLTSVLTSYGQLFSYGAGIMWEGLHKD